MLGTTGGRAGRPGTPAPLGERKVRSAGRGTGSVEVTLPVKLDVLAGVPCTVVLRDGSRPEVVLRPDVSAARAFVQDLWRKLRIGLGGAGEIGEFSLWDFSLALFPPTVPQRRPVLAYADAFLLLQERDAPGPRRREFARLLARLALVAAQRLALEGPWALGFAECVAHVMSGASADLGTDLERAMARRAFWDGGILPPAPSPLRDETWQASAEGIRRIYAQYRSWQAEPEAYERARRRWRGALALADPADEPPESGDAREEALA